MGLPMLLNLYRAGFDVRGFDIQPADRYAENARLMLPDSAAIADADILMIVVRDAAQIDQLCFQQQAVFSAQHWPRNVVVSSTVAPDTIHHLNARLPTDVHLVDAPMSGAPIAAEQATLSYMLGGEPSDVATLMPIFETLGDKIVHCGPLGSGMLAKVMNNYAAACSVVAVRRALARAAELGLQTDMLLRIMKASSGNNWYADNIERISWSHETHEPGNTIGIIEKDVNCALQACSQTSLQPDAFDEALLQALRDLPSFPAE